jgi:hypothetical protein
VALHVTLPPLRFRHVAFSGQFVETAGIDHTYAASACSLNQYAPHTRGLGL